jgi:hypothetical protein
MEDPSMQQMQSDPSVDPSQTAGGEAPSFEHAAPDHAATEAATVHDAGAEHMDAGN